MMLFIRPPYKLKILHFLQLIQISTKNFNTKIWAPKIAPYLTMPDELETVLTHVRKLRFVAF